MPESQIEQLAAASQVPELRSSRRREPSGLYFFYLARERIHSLFAQLPLEGHPHAELFRHAAIDALDRLILPSMEREIRRDLTDGSEKHAVDVFAKNLRSLLLQPPILKQIVLAIDPGFRTGCKLAVLDRSGNLLDQGVIYPHPPQNRRSDAKVFLKDMVAKHQVAVVAIGVALTIGLFWTAPRR